MLPHARQGCVSLQRDFDLNRFSELTGCYRSSPNEAGFQSKCKGLIAPRCCFASRGMRRAMAKSYEINIAWIAEVADHFS
jgi:hypothetical protein